MPTPTPHRITDTQHRENKRQLRELRRQLAALKVEGRVIDARNKQQWESEKQRAEAALAWARALPKERRAYYLTGRWPGEPLGSCVLRHRDQWRAFCRMISEALDHCIVANRAATPPHPSR